MALNVIKQTDTGNFFVDVYRVKNGKPESIGTAYNIVGLHTFLNSCDFLRIDISQPILEDLGQYRRYCEERKKIWIGRGNRDSKLEKIDTLRGDIVESRLSRHL